MTLFIETDSKCDIFSEEIHMTPPHTETSAEGPEQAASARDLVNVTVKFG